MHIYTTSDAMFAAGYTRAHSGWIIKHRDIYIEVRDTSRGSSHGYHYGIFAVPAFDSPIWNSAKARQFDELAKRSFAESVTVNLTEELNRANKPGCCVCAFAPGDYQRGIEAAKSAIDAALDS